MNGAISSMEDVTLGSAKFLQARNVTTQLGEVALVSTEGAVRVDGLIDSAFDVSISAKQNATTNRIFTQGGVVAVETQAGAVNIRSEVRSDGGDVYVSGGAKVATKNIITNGGTIDLISRNKTLTTGFLRSDRSGATGVGGRVYLQAGEEIIVNGSQNVGGTTYSIYTGVSDKEWITIAHELKTEEALRSIFSTDNTAAIGVKSGTKSEVLGQLAFTTETKNPIVEALKLFVIEIFEALTETSPTPSNVVEINPVTGKPYADESEQEFVERLTKRQRNSFNKIINNKAIPKDERLKMEDVRRGTIEDEHGCYYLVLGRQLGGYEEHDIYAYEVTGDTTDHLVMTSRGNYSFYDGKLNAGGIAHYEKGQVIGSYAEVKTQHEYFEKAIDGDFSDMKPKQLQEYLKMKRQIEIGNKVANDCDFQFFLSFDNQRAANAIRTIFSSRYPAMNVYYIEGFGV